MLPSNQIRIREFQDASGKSPFASWFDKLNPRAAAKVTVALTRLEQGNTSNVKSVGSGVHELRIDHGPGYRIYFGRQGNELIILLCGGTKARQRKDIETAKLRWSEFKTRKRKGY
ncbi:MAG: type II toxin-antitoxin system RelE/ParE family toxin [Polyangiales bacterium]